ncbi:glycosyltransferase family protein [Hippea jasoniae]|uniref:hypothetical protein n=1 Tax=Hippea jasoniae TaxID=944479 RepID=UPI0005552338|nr:hypothetical protein [Hippea jasoniae]
MKKESDVINEFIEFFLDNNKITNILSVILSYCIKNYKRVFLNNYIIAFTPYNGLAEKIKELLDLNEVYFFDDYKNEHFIYKIDEIVNFEKSIIIINLSEKYTDLLKEKFARYGYRNFINVPHSIFSKNNINLSLREKVLLLKVLAKITKSKFTNFFLKKNKILVTLISPLSDIYFKLETLSNFYSPDLIVYVVKNQKDAKIIQSQRSIIMEYYDFLMIFLKYRKTKKWVFYINNVHCNGYNEAVVLKSLFKYTKVIFDIGDYLPDLIGNDEKNIKCLTKSWNISEKIALCAYKSAKLIAHYNIVDGIIHRTYGNKVSDMANIKSKNIFFPPVSDFFEINDRLNINKSIVTNLLYIGVIADENRYSKEIYEGSFLSKIFNDICNSGCTIRIYSSHGLNDTLLKLKNKLNDNIEIFSKTPIEEIFDQAKDVPYWGAILENFYRTNPNQNGIDTIPTKLYTYITMGFPIIASESLEATAHIVEKYKIGFVLKKGDEKKLGDILRNKNYNLYRENVIKYLKDKLNKEKLENILMNFYGDILFKEENQ